MVIFCAKRYIIITMADNFSSINWNDLNTFLAVARSRSLRGAARSIKVNHATVKRRLHMLETSLGTRLFDRTPDGFLLSQAGETLMITAENMEKEMISAHRKISGHDAKPAGTVRLNIPPAMLHSFLANEIASFIKANPEIEIDVKASHSYSDLARGEADVAIRMADNVTDDLVGLRVIQYSKAVYASKNYLKNFKSADPEQHTWIGWADDKPYSNWVKDTPFPVLPVRHKVFSNTLQVELAKEGLGFSLLPCFLGDTEPDLLRVPGTTAMPSNSIWILFHRDLQRTARIRAFVDYMVDAIRRNRPLLDGRIE